MKVFVWRSHGEIDVYAFETEAQKSFLKTELVNVLCQEGSEVSSESSWGEIKQAIEDQRYSDSDMFEYGTGFTKVKE